MADEHLLRIDAPPDRDLAAWLATVDSSPTILPEWPESSALAVVMVTADGPATLAHVILAESTLRKAGTGITLSPGVARLFFTVPRSFLLKAGVPGLTKDSWVDHA